MKKKRTSYRECNSCGRVEYVEVNTRGAVLKSTGWRDFVKGLFYESECPKCNRYNTSKAQ